VAKREKTADDRAGGLDVYRRKRAANRTPEPFAGTDRHRPGLFVVQKHAARNMHYDLRLEMGGALQSWAVPRGPSLDPAVKRLAVEVEQHPLEYADFEGIIPDGNYGAGAVVVWDRGRWESLGDVDEGMRKGKLLFDLHGYKLRGRWTLFRTKGKPKEWLLMKKPDGEADPERALPEESIRSGLTVEELRDGVDPAAPILRRLRNAETPAGRPALGEVELMLARVAEEPFTREGWLFEIKYDGYRLLGERDGRRARLRYRRGGDATATFPELASALAGLPHDGLLLDGEVVVLDERGRPSFQRLQRRVQLRRAADVGRATVELPATLFVFDLLGFGDRDLRPLPLVERKKLLRMVLPPFGPLRFCDHIERQGEAMFDEIRRMGLEGVMAKRAGSPYRGGRSDDWLKLRADHCGEFVVAGFSPGRGAAGGYGALHLAVYRDDRLVYAGRVGSGFAAGQLDALAASLASRARDAPACAGETPDDPGHLWVEPGLACEVRYKEWTADGHLRQPVFLELREDLPLEACVRHVESAGEPEPLVAEPSPQPAREVRFTNLDKIFWPDEGYTKGDLIDYYRSVSTWLLPYLRDRPVVLTRYPDGIGGKSFFQKDAPSFVPDWIRTEVMWSEHARREIRYFIADDEETLLYLANMGTIPLHLWSSRVEDLQRPDWCILDLDPKDAPFEHVVRIARRLRALCEEIGLPSYVKTSGSTGLHVLLPLGGQCTYEQSRSLGAVMARIVTRELPEIATITRSPAARGGRVYVDYLQNGHGRLLVSPFCVRPLPGAPVSTPLGWHEVRRGLDIRKHTVRTVPRRFRRRGADPMVEVLEVRPDLTGALELLAGRMD
jgi:bifunctional non-homologous end joining protein LigD